MGTAAHTVARPFNALTGLEVKKIIMNEIERQLAADYRFGNHLTYPQVAWHWVLAVRAYPSDNPEFKIEVDKITMAPEPRANVGAPTEFELDSQRTVAAPQAGETADSARRDAGLTVPSPRVVAGPGGSKIVVDAPDIPLPKSGPDDRPSEVKESSAVKVISKAREIRSASVKTRANPHGITVELPQGASAPDESRLRQIEDLESSKPPEEEQ